MPHAGYDRLNSRYTGDTPAVIGRPPHSTETIGMPKRRQLQSGT